MKKFISITLAGSFLVACATSQPQRKPLPEETAEKEKPPEIVETFDPMTLGEYEQFSLQPVQKEEPFDLEAWVKGYEGQSEEKKVNGFRVQLVSTREEEEARLIRSEALLDLDQPVYLSYDNPYYKVRVGDFTTRSQAERYKEELALRGFPDAWVIRTIINAGPLEKKAVADSLEFPVFEENSLPDTP
jgi:cell division protein FtsN